jgi:hypothetical protein
MSKHHCSCGNPLVSAEAICELCDSRRALEEITREMHSEARNKLRGKPKKFSLTVNEGASMSEIPKDIMDAASWTAIALHKNPNKWIDIIACALLAERNRCDTAAQLRKAIDRFDAAKAEGGAA